MLRDDPLADLWIFEPSEDDKNVLQIETRELITFSSQEECDRLAAALYASAESGPNRVEDFFIGTFAVKIQWESMDNSTDTRRTIASIVHILCRHLNLIRPVVSLLTQQNQKTYRAELELKENVWYE